MSRIGRGAIDLSIPLLTLSLACSDSVPRPNVVVEMDGEEIAYPVFEDFLGRNSASDDGALGSDVLSSMFDQFLTEQLLRKLAVDRQDLGSAIDGRSAVAGLLEQERVFPDENAIAIHYQQNIALYDLPRRVHLRQLLFTDRFMATRIRDLWARGAPYDTVVEEVMADPSAHVGQEGRFLEEELPSTFAEVLFALEESEVSEVLTADYGFHVFQVVRHLPAGTALLSEVGESIAEELSSRQSEEAMERLVTEARGRYNVRVLERNLPFNYRGSYSADKEQANPM